MPKSAEVTVIDIGSSSICAYCAERLSNDNFAVKDPCRIDYSGYAEGKWVKPETVLPSLIKLIEMIERESGRIKTLYVGIPADFCIVRTEYVKVTFPKPKRVTSADIDSLMDANDPFRDAQYTRIHASAVYYLNDKGERLRDPVGTVTSYLKAQLSYIGALSEEISFLRQGLIRHGIKTVRFIQSEYAAALSLFSPEERDGGIILADIGYLTTSVLYVGGDGLLELKTFALGGGMIPIGLSNALDLSFPVADALSAKINLGYKEEGEYSLRYDTSSYSFPIEEVNGIVKECIRCVATYLQKAMKTFRFETSSYATIYLTGGGFSEIRCAKEYLAKCLGRSVETVQPDAPNFGKPYYSTAVGLVKYAFRIEKKERFGFIKRLLGV